MVTVATCDPADLATTPEDLRARGDAEFSR